MQSINLGQGLPPMSQEAVWDQGQIRQDPFQA